MAGKVKNAVTHYVISQALGQFLQRPTASGLLFNVPSWSRFVGYFAILAGSISYALLLFAGYIYLVDYLSFGMALSVTLIALLNLTLLSLGGIGVYFYSKRHSKAKVIESWMSDIEENWDEYLRITKEVYREFKNGFDEAKSVSESPSPENSISEVSPQTASIYNYKRR